MSALAEIAKNNNFIVSGSDANQNDNTNRLKNLGIDVFHGHLAKHVHGASLVVFSSAIKKDNFELVEAKKLNIPILHRGEALASLHNQMFGIAISGSHGKTTTTSLVVSLMNSLDLSPTGIVGGILKGFGTNAIAGTSKYFVAEADESDGSFLHFRPKIAAVTNIDSDHLDHYGSLDEIQKSFGTFSELIEKDGSLIYNADDPRSSKVFNFTGKNLSFGINSNANYRATSVTFDERGSHFKLIHDETEYDCSFNLTGNHNLANALAAIAIVHQVHPELGEVCRALSGFAGAARRFEILTMDDDLVVIDDYAHHPTEIKATIDSFRERFKDRDQKVIFQPHRYTRTRDFWNEFVDVLTIQSELTVLPIYSASESEILNISSERLVEDISKNGGNVKFLNELDSDVFGSTKTQKPVAILSIGAGSISSMMINKVSDWNSKK